MGHRNYKGLEVVADLGIYSIADPVLGRTALPRKALITAIVVGPQSLPRTIVDVAVYVTKDGVDYPIKKSEGDYLPMVVNAVKSAMHIHLGCESKSDPHAVMLSVELGLLKLEDLDLRKDPGSKHLKLTSKWLEPELFESIGENQ